MASSRKTGLGKGFESLIPTHVIDEKFDPTSGQYQTVEKILVRDVEPNPHQPRKNFNQDALKTLASSIDRHGLLQPVVVIRIDDKFRLIAGERRLRAFRHLGEETIPAIVRTVEEQAQMELALIENWQREDVNILEVATALYKLADQFSLNNQEVGERVGRSAASVHNIVRLLGLPEDAKQVLAEGKISEGHARQIMALDPQTDKQKQLLEYILKYNWSVRQAESFVKKFRETGASVKQALQRVEATTDLTKEIAKNLKTKVHIKHMAKTNQLIIEYKSDDELKAIADHLLSIR